MANETKNAQEYVGKVIVVGDNMATIEIKGVQDNGMLSGEFKKGDAAPVMMPVTIPNLEAMMKRGVWKIQGEAVADEPKATEAKSEDDVEEVQDVVPPTPKPKKTEEPKAKEVKMEGEGKPKRKPKTKAESAGVQTTPTEDCSIKTQSPNSGGEAAADKPKDEKPKPEVVSDGKLVYETYTSSKGKACARILGFKSDDAAYKNAIELHGSASWNTTKDGRVLYIAFGPKYAAAAKQVCDALNQGKSFVECKAIIDGAKDTKVPDPSVSSGAKVYTLKEVEGVVRNAFGALAKQLKTDVKAFEPLIEAALKAA